MISEISSSYAYMNYTQQSQSTQTKQMPPDLFQALDEDSSGGIDQTELDTWASNMSSCAGKTINTSGALSAYDADGDGTLSTTELKSFLDASGIKGPGKGRPDLFSALDQDGSGGINQSELDTWATDMSRKTGNTIDTSSAISSYDTDEDGVLSTTELKSFLDASGIQGPNGGPPPGPPPSEAAGATSAADSSQSADSALSSYDTNGDGVLSSSELQAYLDDIGQTSSDGELTAISQAISSYMSNMGKSSADLSYSANLDLSIDIAA